MGWDVQVLVVWCLGCGHPHCSAPLHPPVWNLPLVRVALPKGCVLPPPPPPKSSRGVCCPHAPAPTESSRGVCCPHAPCSLRAAGVCAALLPRPESGRGVWRRPRLERGLPLGCATGAAEAGAPVRRLPWGKLCFRCREIIQNLKRLYWWALSGPFYRR